MAGGRPTKYSKELTDAICDRLANGESMRSICRDPEMPAISSIFKWLREEVEFSEQYALAADMRADAMAEDCLDIADNIEGQPVLIDGVPLVIDGKQVCVIDNVSVQHAKLRVDTRKWHASKIKPKKYGDKLSQELSGPNGGPIEHKATVITTDMDTETAARLYQEALNGLPKP
jgi:hypothetical protein